MASCGSMGKSMPPHGEELNRASQTRLLWAACIRGEGRHNPSSHFLVLSHPVTEVSLHGIIGSSGCLVKDKAHFQYIEEQYESPSNSHPRRFQWEEGTETPILYPPPF